MMAHTTMQCLGWMSCLNKTISCTALFASNYFRIELFIQMKIDNHCPNLGEHYRFDEIRDVYTFSSLCLKPYHIMKLLTPIYSRSFCAWFLVLSLLWLPPLTTKISTSFIIMAARSSLKFHSKTFFSFKELFPLFSEDKNLAQQTN